MESSKKKEKEVVLYHEIHYPNLKEALWQIYSAAFQKLSHKAPERQSLNQQEFEEVLTNSGVHKYVLFDGEVPIGICLIALDLEAVSWIDPEFFRRLFLREAKNKYLYYLMGIAVIPKYASLGHFLLKEAIFSLNEKGVVIIDYSEKQRSQIISFARFALRPQKITLKKIDAQVYYSIRWLKPQ